MAIFKKQGAYWIDYYFQGRRKREKIGASHKLAREVLHKRKLEIAERRFFPERQRASVSFREFGQKYWEAHGRFLRSGNAKHLHAKIIESFGQKTLDQLSAFDFQQFYNKKLQETSASTANRYRDHLHSMFNRAREWGDFAGENPLSKVRKKREENHRLRFLSKDEMETLMMKCNARIYPVLVCALMTGMRKGEILSLQWENVDLEQGVIYILKSKSGKRREVPISSTLREVLSKLGPQREGPVFDVPDITLRRYFSQALKDAKIAGFRFHDLRHTFASHFLMRTNDLPALQRILGHYSPILTQRYAHLAKGHLISEMQIFDAGMPISRLNRHQDGHQPEISAPRDTTKTFVN